MIDEFPFWSTYQIFLQSTLYRYNDLVIFFLLQKHSKKTTVFILLNDEKLFVGQNTICEDVTGRWLLEVYSSILEVIIITVILPH